MKAPKTDQICGEIANVQRKEGKKNPFYIIDILAMIDGFDGKAEECVYQCTAFGKMAEKASSLAVGDYVAVTLYAGARKWQDKWYPNYTLASLEVQSNAVPPEEVAKQAAEKAFEGAENGTTENSDLPF